LRSTAIQQFRENRRPLSPGRMLCGGSQVRRRDDFKDDQSFIEGSLEVAYRQLPGQIEQC
ncbi:MAG: hypothetical protein ACTHQQ_07700, partial [Solirubrobacteraceae bacterium]